MFLAREGGAAPKRDVRLYWGVVGQPLALLTAVGLSLSFEAPGFTPFILYF